MASRRHERDAVLRDIIDAVPVPRFVGFGSDAAKQTPNDQQRLSSGIGRELVGRHCLGFQEALVSP